MAVTTAQELIVRIDRLMIAAKELVGEQYHISGLGCFVKKGGVTFQAPTTEHVRPAHNV